VPRGEVATRDESHRKKWSPATLPVLRVSAVGYNQGHREGGASEEGARREGGGFSSSQPNTARAGALAVAAALASTDRAWHRHRARARASHLQAVGNVAQHQRHGLNAMAWESYDGAGVIAARAERIATSGRTSWHERKGARTECPCAYAGTALLPLRPKSGRTLHESHACRSTGTPRCE
jgi:hypothetical protein